MAHQDGGQARSCKEVLAAVGKLIREAQTLDAAEKELDAYRQYLYCVQSIVHTLSTDILVSGGRGSFEGQQAEKLYGLARSCLERAEGLYSTARDEQRGLDGGARVTAGGAGQQTHSTTQPIQHSQTSYDLQAKPTIRTMPSRALSWPVKQQSAEQSPTGISPLHCISFMDEAKARNHHLMRQYQSHLRQTSSKMLPRQYHDVGLSMLRRLEENVAVAKIRQQAMTHKLRERELRIRQEAARSNKQRTSSIALSNMSLEEITEQVASYETGKNNLALLKMVLKTKPNPPVNVYNLVNEVLSMPDHPLAKLLGEGQYSVYLMLKPISTAIEKAGGLPSIYISLDTGGTQTGVPSQPSVEASSSHDGSHMDLLCSEEDDELLTLSTSPRPHVNVPPSEDDLEGRLAMLRSSLVNEISDREEKESSGEERSTSHARGRGSSNAEHNYAVLEPGCLNNGRTSQDENIYAALDTDFMDEPNIYEAVRGSLYDNAEEIAAYFEEKRAGNVPLPADEPDGAMMSRVPGPSDPARDEEEEEEVEFKNLPRLVCSLHTGNEAILLELADTASSVLKETVKLIHFYLEKLEKAFVSCYSSLRSEENQELCRTVLEASFFPAILPSLVLVYRCRHYKEELATARNMCRHVNVTPKDVSVRKRFWLIEQSHAPYGEAIDKVRTITSLHCPSPKLDCLVQLSKLIIQCIEEFYEAMDKPASTDIGVDDILPILTYVIIRSGLPQLVTECAIMEEFIQEGYMKGEEGFCLTSFMTALKFVSRMSS